MSTRKARTIRLMLKAADINQAFILSTIGFGLVAYTISTIPASF